eukprot:1265625-Lingulodinium_polyedra.AAC.1
MACSRVWPCAGGRADSYGVSQVLRCIAAIPTYGQCPLPRFQAPGRRPQRAPWGAGQVGQVGHNRTGVRAVGFGALHCGASGASWASGPKWGQRGQVVQVVQWARGTAGQ